MTLTTDQERAILLLMSGLKVAPDQPLIKVIFELRDTLVSRQTLRNQLNEIAAGAFA